MATPTHQDARLMVELSKLAAQRGVRADWLQSTEFDPDYAQFVATNPHGSDGYDKARRIAQHYELIGTLWKNGLIDEDLLFDWLAITAIWTRIRGFVLGERQAFGEPTLGENFEAMASRQERRLIAADENKDLVRRFVEEVWSQGKLEVLDDIYAPTYRSHARWPNPIRIVSDDAAPEESTTADFKKSIAAVRAAFSDMQVTLDDVMAEGDRVMFRATTRGTHSGEMHGVAPTGKQMWWTNFGVARVESGKIVEEWYLWDRLGFFQQLGLVPETRALRRAPATT